MKLTRNHLTLGFLAVVAVAAVAAVAGFPLVNYLPPDVLAALGAAGALPFAMSGETTIAERIAEFETKHKQLVDEKDALVKKVTIEEGRTFDDHEKEQLTNFTADIGSLADTLKELKAHETSMVSKGTTVTTVDTPALGSAGSAGSGVELRGGVITVKRNLPKGTAFTRFSIAMAQAKGNVMMAHQTALTRFKDTPEVASALQAAIRFGGTRELKEMAVEAVKASVVFGTTTDSSFVGPLVQYNDMEAEFVDLLRPKTIMGKMTQLNRVPFMSRMARQLTGVSGSFVGEGAPKPVGKQTYDNVTVPFAKAAVIVVLSDEAVRFSSPNAEVKARDDMIKGISQYLDRRFMDPAYSGVANVSPASITNGAVRYQSSGSTIAAIDADVAKAMAMFADSEIDPTTAVWVMPASVALKLSMKRTSQDEKAYPELSMLGGTWYGIPVIVSNSMVASGSPAEKQIALVTQEEVLLADDGGVSIDMSQEASVQMDDAPTAGATSLVSLWQNNLVGIRAEQYINWRARRPNNLGIALIENTNY